MGGKSSKSAPSTEKTPAEKTSQTSSTRKGCCGCSSGPAEEFGMIPTQQRKCRDSLCCLLFFIFWAGMIAVGAFGIYFGNPARLLYGIDYKGQVCGSSESVKSSKYIVYPRVNEDFLANVCYIPYITLSLSSSLSRSRSLTIITNPIFSFFLFPFL